MIYLAVCLLLVYAVLHINIEIIFDYLDRVENEYCLELLANYARSK